ncbi:TPA: hypothetical protein ACQ31I_001451 [Yersinia enterocolitica]
MIPRESCTQKYISSQITSDSVRVNLKKDKSSHFVGGIKRLYNSIQSSAMKNSYSPCRMEIKSKLKEHKIQIDLKEIKYQAEEKEIENDLKKMNISGPLTSVVPVSVFGDTQPTDIKYRNNNELINVTYQDQYGRNVTLESHFPKINMPQIAIITPGNAMAQLNTTGL